MAEGHAGRGAEQGQLQLPLRQETPFLVQSQATPLAGSCFPTMHRGLSQPGLGGVTEFFLVLPKLASVFLGTRPPRLGMRLPEAGLL